MQIIPRLSRGSAAPTGADRLVGSDPRGPWRAWYGLARWKRRRAAQLAAEPLCARCLAEDPPRVTPATVADHPIPHRGDPDLFWNQPLTSLCKWHHDAEKQSEEKSLHPRGGG